jgi:acylphosphatase
MIRLHIFISGRVQGVLFRIKMYQKAKKVSGFVRNLNDGRVEAVIEGEKEQVDKLLKWAKKGTIFSRIDNIKVIEENYKGEFNNFNIVY